MSTRENFSGGILAQNKGELTADTIRHLGYDTEVVSNKKQAQLEVRAKAVKQIKDSLLNGTRSD